MAMSRLAGRRGHTFALRAGSQSGHTFALRASSQRGHTLSEALITVAILGILAAVLAPIMVNITNFWRQTTARSDIQRDVRVSLETMNRYLRQGRANTVIIDQVTGQPPFSRISFQTDKEQQLTFWQNGNLFMMEITSGTTTTSQLSSRLGFLAFTYPRSDDDSIVSVAITMEAPTYLGGKKALQLSIAKVRIMN